LNKSELIDAVALASDLPKTSVSRAVNAALEAIAKALKKKDDVVLWSALVPSRCAGWQRASHAIPGPGR
jgi:hypothetical protein